MRHSILRLLTALTVLGGLALAAPAAEAETVRPRSEVQVQSATAGCLTTYHSRPTTSGWHRDPCAYTIVTEPDIYGQTYVRMVAAIDFEWSMTGGAHITGVRSATRITDLEYEIDWQQITDVNVGRTNGHSGVLWSQPQAVRTTGADLLLYGYDISGVGCGDYVNSPGSGSYGVHSHVWLAWLPYFSENIFTRDFYSGQSYYQFSADGTC